MVRNQKSIAVFIALLAFACSSAQAVPITALITGGDTNRNGHTGLVGGTFSANLSGTVMINQLGFIDIGLDGLATAHDVGLYEYNGTNFTLLTKATVPAGVAATLDGGYRWVATNPVTLSNTTPTWYLVMATVVSGDGDVWQNNTNAYNSAIGGLAAHQYYTNVASIGLVGSTLAVIANESGKMYNAGNVGFAVPEPTGFALLVIGGLFTRRIARRCRV